MEWKQKVPIYNSKPFDSIHKQLANIHGIDDLPEYLMPNSDHLHNPYLMKNIENAAQRIKQAVLRDEKISIYIDIDSDGCTSGIIAYNYLKNFTDNICYFHAQRSDGHSIDVSENNIPEETNVLLIIDSSTNSVDSCKRISEKGIDILVIDHHEQDVLNPYCMVLVNPQQEGCDYPNKHLSAAGVILKLCQILDDIFDEDLSEQYYDLVAIGLQGDMMSMLEVENRFLVYKGLKNIKNLGLTSMLKSLNKDIDKLTSTDISFIIAPCFNAACRMDKIEVILDLLTEQDEIKCMEKAKEAIELNEERKRIQTDFTNKLLKQVDFNSRYSIIIDNSVGKGFKGLIAGDFSSEFQQHVMVLSLNDDDTYSGSYRSFNNFNLKSFLLNIPEIIYAAGHAQAGGLMFKKSDLPIIQKHLEKNLPEIDRGLEYIMEFDVKEITEPLVRNIELFYKISGNGIKTGNFKIKNITPTTKKILGKKRNTIKLNTYPSSQIMFYEEDEYEDLDSCLTLMKFRTDENSIPDDIIGKNIEVVGTLNCNEFTNYKGKTTKSLQLFIEDWKEIDD